MEPSVCVWHFMRLLLLLGSMGKGGAGTFSADPRLHRNGIGTAQSGPECAPGSSGVLPRSEGVVLPPGDGHLG